MADPNNPTSAPDTPVQQAPSGGTANGTSATSISRVVAVFVQVVTPLLTNLNNSLQTLAPTDSAHHDKIGANRLQVVPMVSAMLRDAPVLAGMTGDELDAVMADADACDGLSRLFKTAAAAADSTARLRRELAWQVSSGAITTGRKMAAHNANVAKDIAGIDAALARGPKAVQAAHAAITKQAKATKAAVRATKAEQTAATATARANALQHGTGDATITQPAPSAPAPSTAAPSAPAPETPPATPGSSTIR